MKFSFIRQIIKEFALKICIYYIYQIYKNQTISNIYISKNHYRIFFEFTDVVPHLDDIFDNYDVILNIQYDT